MLRILYHYVKQKATENTVAYIEVFIIFLYAAESCTLSGQIINIKDCFAADKREYTHSIYCRGPIQAALHISSHRMQPPIRRGQFPRGTDFDSVHLKKRE